MTTSVAPPTQGGVDHLDQLENRSVHILREAYASFKNLGMWSRGVDTALFRPRAKSFLDAPRPVFLYLGRAAVEKNIEAFLKLELPGTKVVVGGGPDLEMLRKKYPAARFTAPRHPRDP